MKRKEFWKYALERAARTFLQSFVSFAAVSTTLYDVNWIQMFGVAGLSALISLATSLSAQLPEQKLEEEFKNLSENAAEVQEKYEDLVKKYTDLCTEMKSDKITDVKGYK